MTALFAGAHDFNIDQFTYAEKYVTVEGRSGARAMKRESCNGAELREVVTEAAPLSRASEPRSKRCTA